jgi:hypothetical protein
LPIFCFFFLKTIFMEQNIVFQKVFHLKFMTLNLYRASKH